MLQIWDRIIEFIAMVLFFYPFIFLGSCLVSKKSALIGFFQNTYAGIRKNPPGV
jgi:hypothetical protein